MILAKVDLRHIVYEHLRSLNIVKEGRKAHQIERGGNGIEEGILFYVIPAAVAVSAGFFLDWSLPESAASSLTSTLSIFAPLLFNVLVLAFRMASAPERHDFPEAQQNLIQEVYANTAYSILVALIALLFLLLLDFLDGSGVVVETVSSSLSVAVILLVLNFILTLFMVLKRMYLLMERHV